MIKIKAKISKCVYPKTETDDITWRIIVTDIGTFKGNAPNVKPNEIYTFNGTWAEYKGQKEFKFIGIDPYIAGNPKEELQIAIGMTSGLGEKIGERIWDKFGENWKDVKSGDVNGLTEKRFSALQDTITSMELNKSMVKTVSFLMSKGVTEGVSKKAYNEWKLDCIKLVSDNPYILTQLPHVGFIEIDERVRRQFGIEDTSKFRIESCVFYCIGASLNKGDSVIGWREYSTEVLNLLKIEPKLITEVITELIKDKKLVFFKDENLITTERLYRYEENIYNFLMGE